MLHLTHTRKITLKGAFCSGCKKLMRHCTC